MIPVFRKNSIPDRIITDEGCLILIDKDENWTSFDVVKKIKSITKKKTGHAGTLDPFAAGLMIIGIARGTKSLGRLSGLSKQYFAEIELGVETNTYDRTGSVVHKMPADHLSDKQIQDAVNQLSGEIYQTPPMFSAKKYNGIRLYKLARKNIEIERRPEKITIFSAEIMEFKNPVLKLKLDVSKGTYVRTYAHDLGKILMTGANLKSLKRITIGEWNIADSFKVTEFEGVWNNSVRKNENNRVY